jgi:uncharacterized protein YndB with AHSA1/START domain
MASREDVFRAWTDPGIVPRWFGGLEGFITANAELDPRPGGRFRFAIDFPDGQRTYAVGKYLEFDPPRRLVFTWGWEGMLPDAGESLVTVDFFAVGSETDLMITHERNASEDIASFHAFGWNLSVKRLERLWN